MVNYDADGVPNLDAQAAAEAKSFGLQTILVVCDEPGAKVGDTGAVSFYSFSESLPRAGERITLEDGTLCQVRTIYWKLSRPPGSRFTMLVPNVFAVRISPDQADA